MNINRRNFLLLIASTAPIAVASCATQRIDLEEAIRQCGPSARSKNDPIRIDMHCHLFNIKEIAEEKFLAQRYFNLDERAGRVTEVFATQIAKLLGDLFDNDVKELDLERAQLSAELEDASQAHPLWQSDPNFCKYADKEQDGPLRGNPRTQFTGMFSNRIRNAARMMTLFPKVDLFVPLMVDLFEDEAEYQDPADNTKYLPPDIKAKLRVHPISTQINFYSNLNLATRGRFLPMMSFNPARQFVMDEQGGLGMDYFDWIERAIKHLGFIGVKVHPSYGFSPDDNLKYACYFSARNGDLPGDRELYRRFSAFDEHMEQLLALCKKLDVPIITHNGDSLSLNQNCMQGTLADGVNNSNIPSEGSLMPLGEVGDQEAGEWAYSFRNRPNAGIRENSDWTNSPNSWLRAMANADKNNAGPPLRVCLSHFANGFKKREERSILDGWNARADQIQRSHWLEDAITAKNPNLFADLSIMSELVPPKKSTKRATEIHSRYVQLLSEVLAENSELAKNTMYGSDWHMPGAALKGADFYSGIEKVIEQISQDIGEPSLADNIMGGTASDFLGLRVGQANRERLAEFYKKANNLELVPRDGSSGSVGQRDLSVSTDEIGWWDKV